MIYNSMKHLKYSIWMPITSNWINWHFVYIPFISLDHINKITNENITSLSKLWERLHVLQLLGSQHLFCKVSRILVEVFCTRDIDHKFMMQQKLIEFDGAHSLKSLSKYCWDYKRGQQIHHKIMVFHGFPKPTSMKHMDD